jgi:peptidoglycan-associated lipoprotein
MTPGCKKRAVVAPPVPSAPVTASAPEPSVTFSADPAAIELGQSSTLNWSTTHATIVSIDQNIGEVAISGSASVSPESSTTYTITVSGEGGTATASTRITVAVPRPATTAQPETESSEELFGRNVKDIYFDYDQAEVRGDAKLALASAAEFFAQNKSVRVAIEGHCDERGSLEYNLGLGDRRATAARGYLANLGVSIDRMKAISYGKERPQCQEAEEECYQRNRRAHFVLAHP